MIHLVFLIVNFFIEGFVISTVWRWHVITVFPSLPPLTVAQAAMLSYLFAFATFNSLNILEAEELSWEDQMTCRLHGNVTMPLLTLAIAAIVRWFQGGFGG